MAGDARRALPEDRAMTGLGGLKTTIRARRIAIAILLALPVALLVAFTAWAIRPTLLLPAIVCAAIALVLVAVLAARTITPRVVARRLDARRFDFEDSADLLLRDDATLNPLERLQRERIVARLAQVDPQRLLDPVPWRRIGGIAAASTLVALAILLWPSARPTETSREARRAAAPSATETRVVDRRATITPPAYTGVAVRTTRDADLRVEAGATVEWSLQIDPLPRAARLVFHDKTAVALTVADGRFVGRREIATPTLYRLEIEGGPPLTDRALHRIETIPDRAPEIRVVAPDRTLTIRAAGQGSWPLAFEVKDDYGLGAATLSVTLAKGSGENIEVSTQSIALAGEGDARSKRYRRTLDLAALGIAAGDDVIVRLSVKDRRAPTPNESRSPSFILRWPPETGSEASGVEGLVRDALPAYFRSQRQIIIDTEALIAERGKLSADDFGVKSDTIGVDQRVLRLRYGQFLGEEAPEQEEDHAEAEGSAGELNVLEQFGHVHDESEAATMLDEATKKILRRALAAMWDAELHLRSARPSEALPFEYRALEAIKEVQQATRIYLARVGTELPPLDAARRLTGDLATAKSSRSALAPAAREAGFDALWASLSRGEPVDLADVDAWLATLDANDERVLPVVAALDRARNEPDCAECRVALAGKLFAVVEPPKPAIAPRRAPDDAGRAYLEALRE